MEPLAAIKSAIWNTDAQCVDNALPSFSAAMLATLVMVLQSDGPLNQYEALFLDELFGPRLDTGSTEVELKLDPTRSAHAIDDLIIAAGRLPYSSDVISLIGRVFDLSLAADKIPSEAEAWAAAKVLSKIRGTSMASVIGRRAGKPAEPPPAPEPELILEPAVPQAPVRPTRETRRVPRPEQTNPTATTDDVNELLLELHRLVGLESVKLQVETLMNLAKVRAMRTQRGLPSPPMSFHLVFAGNPGTGKTTVARLIGKIYGMLGLLSQGKCIEVDRTHLIGQYLGETTTKTADVLNRALGSVLFIDEAYSLTEGSGGDKANAYGLEAITVLLKFMEDHRDDFVVIAAGYTELMDQFLDSNPGLRSRFSRTIEFPDYSADELIEIFHRICSASGYAVAAGAESVLSARMKDILGLRTEHFANAREARKLFEAALERQANRIANQHCSDSELCTLEAVDLVDAV